MNESLFTDLTPAQAETIAAGASEQFIVASAGYGYTSAVLKRTGDNSFSVQDLYVADLERDGFAVYAKFRVQATDGSFLSTSTKRYDRKGASASGMHYKNLSASFSKDIKSIQLEIYQDKPGTDPRTRGPLTALNSL